MKAGHIRCRTALVAAVAAAVCGTGMAAGNPGDEFIGTARRGQSLVADPNTAEIAVRSRYIVVLKEAPLALAGQMPRRGTAKRVAVESHEAQSYVSKLRAQQESFVADAGRLLGRKIAPTQRFQHAINGLVTELTDDEAVALRAHPSVALVEADVEYRPDTDSGPTVIGAPGVWGGSGTPGNLPTKGAGVVIGVLDTGINQASPSFAAVGEDGYRHVNPLGSGRYLGLCDPADPNHVAGRDICNDKFIGAWDYADAEAADDTSAGVYEARGIEDEDGHGSHTSSIALGNARAVRFNGVARNISGVAPHANLVAYDVCYFSPPSGSCPSSATTAAVNQAVADGIVDVLSYSISGGVSPWTQSTSLAFLGAQNAGIVIAASAGNSGPAPSTLGHLEPWVVTVGGTMHDRVFGFPFALTAPGAPPPANVQSITVRPGSAPIATASLAGPIVVSPNFANGGTDGCAPFPVDYFKRASPTGAAVPTIAVLHLDAATTQCGSGVRRVAALAAGAAGVVFVDDTPLSLGANGTSYSMMMSDWRRVAAQIATDPANAAARIDVPLTAGPGTPDTVYASTSRGPNPYNLLKPDLAAPAVEILATYTRWAEAAPAPFGGAVDTSLDATVNAINGTSMAAPHVAGSLALLRALNRSWTPAQLKSALMTTANPNVTDSDGTTTPPFATGAGRIDVARASKAGLVLDETGANYLAANPATGGDPSQLNIASFQNLQCLSTCTFLRTLESTRRGSVTWTATLEGLPEGSGVAVAPASFTVVNFGTANIKLSADSARLPKDRVTFGRLVLTPSDASIPTARLPIALQPRAPDIDISPTSLSATGLRGVSAERELILRNVGNPTITWDIDDAGTATLALQRQAFDGSWGNQSNFHVGQGAAGAGSYVAEDFVPAGPETLRTIDVEGFLLGTGGAMQATARDITFKVYADDRGKPAGQPEGGSAGELYSCTRTMSGAGSAGLAFRAASGGSFGLNLEAAAAAVAPANCPAPPTLAPNARYWVVVYPRMPGTMEARRWFLGRATTTNGLPPMFIAPNLTGDDQQLQWHALDPIAGPPAALASSALSVTTTVACDSPWLTAVPAAGTLGLAGSTKTVVAADASRLAVGRHYGYVCVDTNGTDPDEARTAVPFFLTVTSASNRPPVFANRAFAFGVEPAAANGTRVGTVVATDPNAGDVLVYAITAGNTAGTFAMDPATGAITLVGGPFATGAVFDLTVTATDAEGSSDTATVRIDGRRRILPPIP